MCLLTVAKRWSTASPCMAWFVHDHDSMFMGWLELDSESWEPLIIIILILPLGPSRKMKEQARRQGSAPGRSCCRRELRGGGRARPPARLREARGRPGPGPGLGGAGVGARGGGCGARGRRRGGAWARTAPGAQRSPPPQAPAWPTPPPPPPWWELRWLAVD